MKRILSALLFSIAPLMAQDYKIAIVGLIHSHVGTFAIGFAWKSGETGGHCGSEPRPCGRGQKDGGCGLAVLQRLQEDARPGEAGYRLGVRRKQPASGDCRGMRATPDQCDV